MTQQTPPPFETARAHGTPLIRQFSVFLDNRIGKLYELLEIFDEQENIEICGLSVVDSTDHAVIRLILNNSTLARKLLREHEMPFSELNVLVAELSPDRSLTGMCLYMLGAEIGILFAYPLLCQQDEPAKVVLGVDDLILACEILRKKQYRLLGEEDLAGSGSDWE